MDQRGGHIDPNSRRGSCDADGLRASELEHAVQSTNGDRDFCGLTIVCARTERIADHPFVARDRRLRLGPGVVAGSLRPAPTATFGAQLQMPVALGRRGRGGLPLGTALARGGTTTAASGWRSATAAPSTRSSQGPTCAPSSTSLLVSSAAVIAPVAASTPRGSLRQ